MQSNGLSYNNGNFNAERVQELTKKRRIPLQPQSHLLCDIKHSPTIKNVDLDRINDILNLSYRRKLCHTTFAFTLTTDDRTDEKTIDCTPTTCQIPNCPDCFPERYQKLRKRLLPIWESIDKVRPGARTTHIIATFPPVSYDDMNPKEYDRHRLKGRSLQKALKRENPNYLIRGVFEVKYVPELDEFHPHYHIFIFSRIISTATELQDRWTSINSGIYHKLRCKYSPSRERGQKIKTYNERLKARRYSALDYLCRRSAGVGLVMEDDPLSRVENNISKPDNRPLEEIKDPMLRRENYYEYYKFPENIVGSIPMDKFVEVLYRRQTIFSSGKLPQRILAVWEILVQEKKEEKSHKTVFYLGVIPKSKSETIPPPKSMNLRGLTSEYNRLSQTPEGQLMTEPALWFNAFHNYNNITPPERPEKEFKIKTGYGGARRVTYRILTNEQALILWNGGTVNVKETTEWNHG